MPKEERSSWKNIEACLLNRVINIDSWHWNKIKAFINMRNLDYSLNLKLHLLLCKGIKTVIILKRLLILKLIKFCLYFMQKKIVKS